VGDDHHLAKDIRGFRLPVTAGFLLLAVVAAAGFPLATTAGFPLSATAVNHTVIDLCTTTSSTTVIAQMRKKVN